MDNELSLNVLSVTPRIVGNNKTIYDVALSDGNTYATFDSAIYAKAQPLIGQPASVRVRIGPSKKNPQYTDYFINDIAPQGQLPPPGVTVHAPAPPMTPQSAPQIARAPQNGGMSPEREQKIVKQSSFSTAFNFVASLYQGAGVEEFEPAVGLAHSLAKELYGHVMGEKQAEAAPEPVAAGVAGAPPENTGDAIPWL